MSKPIIKILAIVGGVAAVGTGGFFGFRWWRKKHKDEDANAAIEVEYIAYDPNAMSEKESIVRDTDDAAARQEDIPRDAMAKGVRSYMQPSDEERINFEEYLAGMESPEDDELDEYGEDDIRRGADEPYPITAGEFCNTRTYYDKVSLNYFQEDDVVSDDRDEVMENASQILGDLQSAMGRADGRNLVYIRNEALEVDYEITLVDGSYRKEVLHME